MILPEKHINILESYFGFGGYLLQLINKKETVDSLWEKFSLVNDTSEFPEYHSFDNFIYALNYLFIIGAINQDEKGGIYCEIN